jgi:hypothetical protein
MISLVLTKKMIYLAFSISFTLKSLLTQHLRKEIENVLNFLDFRDSISYLMKTFHANIQSFITHNFYVSELFEIQKDCRQINLLSPHIFIHAQKY